MFLFFFFFNDTATTEIYTLSLHDALPIYCARATPANRSIARTTTEKSSSLCAASCRACSAAATCTAAADRKSTRLNSSHLVISYAVFCLKKKKMFPNMQLYVWSFDLGIIC